MGQRPQNSEGIENWLRLIRADGVGPVLFARLIEHFGTIDRALGASVAEMAKVDGIGLKTGESIATSRDRFDSCDELDLAEKLGVWLVHSQDERYPAALKRIHDPPPVLYVKGDMTKADNLAVAVVGSRRCSLYGQEQASRFAHLLAASGFTIVSGLARGIDTAAHQGALAAGGRTIAVQGCGLANVFPPENAKLFDMIALNGACVSELPLRSEPLPEHFPPRNRIIAGLSLGVIVVEAALRSGALITAQTALECNREVMAIPGKIDSPLSQGGHRLIKDGAKLVESVEDVMEALGYIGEQLKEHCAAAAEEAGRRVEASLFDTSEGLNLKGNELRIYESLAKEPTHSDQIIAMTGLGPGVVNAGLIALRLKGIVRQLPGNLFARR
jgi:DNA processing protein